MSRLTLIEKMCIVMMVIIFSSLCYGVFKLVSYFN